MSYWQLWKLKIFLIHIPDRAWVVSAKVALHVVCFQTIHSYPLGLASKGEKVVQVPQPEVLSLSAEASNKLPSYCQKWDKCYFFMTLAPDGDCYWFSSGYSLQSWRVISALWWLTRVGSVQVDAVNSLCPVVIARAVWSWSILKVRDGLCPGARLYFEEMPCMTFPMCWDESLEVLELHMMPEEPLKGPSAGAPNHVLCLDARWGPPWTQTSKA